jgi:hypothetical protein
MKTIENAWDIMEGLNNDAHDSAWDTWVEADRLADEGEEDDDWIRAEELREEASMEQAGYFRDNWSGLNSEDREVVEHWLKQDAEFRESFSMYFGEDEFRDQWPEYAED